MSAIALSVMPFAGHVHPALALAEELVRRGHDVVVYTGAKYAPRFTAAGARWEPWAEARDFDDADLAATFPETGSGTGMKAGRANGEHIVLGTGPGQARDLLALARREPLDLVVSDQVSTDGAMAAEKLGLPLVTLTVIPLILTSRHLAPVGMRLQPARSAAGRARDAVLRGVAAAGTRRLLDPMINRVRAQVGLEPARVSGFDGFFSRELVLAQGVPELDYPRPDLPSWVHHVGGLAPAATQRGDELP